MIYQPIDPIVDGTSQIEAISNMQHLGGEISDEEFLNLLHLVLEWSTDTQKRVDLVVDKMNNGNAAAKRLAFTRNEGFAKDHE